jgi:hypothetical protein
MSKYTTRILRMWTIGALTGLFLMAAIVGIESWLWFIGFAFVSIFTMVKWGVEGSHD